MTNVNINTISNQITFDSLNSQIPQDNINHNLNTRNDINAYRLSKCNPNSNTPISQSQTQTQYKVFHTPTQSVTTPTHTSTKTEPIKSLEQIKEIKTYLSTKDSRYSNLNLRDYLLFVIGINDVQRISDLRCLRIRDIIDYKESNNTVGIKPVNSKVFYKPIKTIKYDNNKLHSFFITKTMHDALEQYFFYNTDEHRELILNPDNWDRYIFESRQINSQGNREAITRGRAWQIMKDVQNKLNIEENIGTHSLRKTGAYHTYVNGVKSNNPQALSITQKRLNHKDQNTTLAYLGINDKEYLNILGEGL